MNMSDCGAQPPDDGCGECDYCREELAAGIEREYEGGNITREEALERHDANGTYR